MMHHLLEILSASKNMQHINYMPYQRQEIKSTTVSAYHPLAFVSTNVPQVLEQETISALQEDLVLKTICHDAELAKNLTCRHSPSDKREIHTGELMTSKHLFTPKIISEFRGTTAAEVTLSAEADISPEQGGHGAPETNVTTCQNIVPMSQTILMASQDLC